MANHPNILDIGRTILAFPQAVVVCTARCPRRIVLSLQSTFSLRSNSNFTSCLIPSAAPISLDAFAGTTWSKKRRTKNFGCTSRVIVWQVKEQRCHLWWTRYQWCITQCVELTWKWLDALGLTWWGSWAHYSLVSCEPSFFLCEPLQNVIETILCIGFRVAMGYVKDIWSTWAPTNHNICSLWGVGCVQMYHYFDVSVNRHQGSGL